ncbi:MAG: hypothetical protein H8E36_14795 [Rhodospirillaceae bacterium]|nr:hypothetical protein [Rhodospirillaceae bacterium]MBL6941304.1 hypothetical protein [Rhodospirillales bacterium]
MRAGVLRIVLVLSAVFIAAQPAYALEPFNIKGIVLGDTLEDLKKVFPEIEIEAFENKAHCKGGDVVIENGSSFNGVKKEDDQEYSFKLIFIDGVQSVVKAEFTYAATSVSRDLFISRINEKYDIDDINLENIATVKDAMSDYSGITDFIVPTGHFFKIGEDDVFRLKYASLSKGPLAPGELTHTIIIESKKYRLLDEKQQELGKQEKVDKENECGKQELQELGF